MSFSIQALMTSVATTRKPLRAAGERKKRATPAAPARQQTRLLAPARRARELGRELSAIFDLSGDAILTETSNGIILGWNNGARKMFGYTAAEIIGQPAAMLIPPDRSRELARLRAKLLRGERVRPLETVRVAKDGRRVQVTLSMAPIRDRRGRFVVAATIAREASGNERVEEQLRQAHKMEAIGRLAGGIAHDFNTLLGVILGGSEVLLADTKLDASQRTALEEIREASERAASLTRQLLAFSRQQVLEKQALDLNSTLRGFESLLRRTVGPEVDLVFRLAPNLGAVRADPTQLLQVVMNLMTNARDAMSRRGRIRIETARVSLNDSFARRHPGVRPGPHVLLSVADSGSGMNRETQAHLFEPFFTTKQKGKGVGLGLATVYGIVRQSNGAVRCRSELGRGTAFEIYLPQVEPIAERNSSPKLAGVIPRGSETVLVVEDSELLRRISTEFLERLGYTVLTAESGPGALAVARRYRKPIHLLLTDVAMPGMNGQELAQHLTAERPATRVLYASGYASAVAPELYPDDARIDFIEKPYSWQNLASRVRVLLDKK